MFTAIITGARGQDATLLSALLTEKGWNVVGTVRPGAWFQVVGRRVVEVDLHSRVAVRELVRSVRPTHIFHQAACHHSSEQAPAAKIESEMVETNFYASELLLSASIDLGSECRLIFAGSSQMYSRPEVGVLVIDENTTMRPSTFYGHTKMWCRQLIDHYRTRFGVSASMCILFNHESRLRPPGFLSRKISIAAARAKLGLSSSIRIQNIAARADWSSAEDIVNGMLGAATAIAPEDFVLSSGSALSVEQLLETVFASVGLSWRDHVIADNCTAGGALVGNSNKAQRILGWTPWHPIDEVLRNIVLCDIDELSRDPRIPVRDVKWGNK